MKEIIPLLAAHARVPDQDLLENDVRLHLLLGEIIGDDALGNHLIFKGGTCLIKCYLDYPRFSTDLDFSWRFDENQTSLGSKALRRNLRPVQRELVHRLAQHAAILDLPLVPERDVQYGQSNRMMTVSFHYENVSGLPALIEVQVNFAEPLLYPIRHVKAKSLLKGKLPSVARLFDSTVPQRYLHPVPVEAYDPREILTEKCRAILTRTAAKTRDILDLFLLEAQLGLKVEAYTPDILMKVRSSLVHSARYRRQLEFANDRLGLLLEEDVRPLLLKPVDTVAFNSFRHRIVPFLRSLSDEV